jgi:hypothetical protein
VVARRRGGRRIDAGRLAAGSDGATGYRKNSHFVGPAIGLARTTVEVLSMADRIAATVEGVS